MHQDRQEPYAFISIYEHVHRKRQDDFTELFTFTVMIIIEKNMASNTKNCYQHTKNARLTFLRIERTTNRPACIQSACAN